jgi:hypothetical protein
MQVISHAKKEKNWMGFQLEIALSNNETQYTHSKCMNKGKNV